MSYHVQFAQGQCMHRALDVQQILTFESVQECEQNLVLMAVHWHHTVRQHSTMHKTCSLQIPHVLALKFNFRTLQTETTSTNFKNLMLTDKNKNNVKCYISHSIIIIICSGKPTLENFSMLIICRTEAVTNLFYSLSKSA